MIPVKRAVLDVECTALISHDAVTIAYAVGNGQSVKRECLAAVD